MAQDSQPHAWVRVQGEETVFESRVGFLKDFAVDPEELRDPKFTGLESDEVDRWLLELLVDEDPKMVGTTPGKRIGDVWQWEDGRPVPGSTPKRLAERVASMEAQEFIDTPKGLKAYGLDAPVARVTLWDLNDEQVVLLFGGEGEPRRDIEDRVLPRIWVMVENGDSVYLVDKGVLDVLADARREHNRKLKKDVEKAERQELIEDP